MGRPDLCNCFCGATGASGGTGATGASGGTGATGATGPNNWGFQCITTFGLTQCLPSFGGPYTDWTCDGDCDEVPPPPPSDDYYYTLIPCPDEYGNSTELTLTAHSTIRYGRGRVFFLPYAPEGGEYINDGWCWKIVAYAVGPTTIELPERSHDNCAECNSDCHLVECGGPITIDCLPGYIVSCFTCECVPDPGATGPTPTGACCVPGVGCVDNVTQQECTDLGGDWFPDDACGPAVSCLG